MALYLSGDWQYKASITNNKKLKETWRLVVRLGITSLTKTRTRALLRSADRDGRQRRQYRSVLSWDHASVDEGGMSLGVKVLRNNHVSRVRKSRKQDESTFQFDKLMIFERTYLSSNEPHIRKPSTPFPSIQCRNNDSNPSHQLIKPSVISIAEQPWRQSHPPRRGRW
jgi:hypothetical protein